MNKMQRGCALISSTSLGRVIGLCEGCSSSDPSVVLLGVDRWLVP